MPGWSVTALGGALGAALGLWIRGRQTAHQLEMRGLALEASLGQQGSQLASYLTSKGSEVEAEVRRIGQQHAELVARKHALELLRVKYHLSPEMFRAGGQER